MSLFYVKKKTNPMNMFHFIVCSLVFHLDDVQLVCQIGLFSTFSVQLIFVLPGKGFVYLVQSNVKPRFVSACCSYSFACFSFSQRKI